MTSPLTAPPKRVFAVVPLAVLALGGATCVPEPAPEESTSLRDTLLKDGSNVVTARIFQAGTWVIDECKDADSEERQKECAQHVCKGLAPLKPHYVSGLIRLAWDTKVKQNQIEIFKRVKICRSGPTTRSGTGRY